VRGELSAAFKECRHVVLSPGAAGV